jgi:asparagine synthase (glutamine-hydrolysing)
VSRIVTLVHRDERPLASGTVRALAGAMDQQADVPPRVWTCGRAGFAHQHPGTRDGKPPAPPGPLAFDGRLDNRDELIDLLSLDRGERCAPSDEALIVACYHRFGDAFAGRLNGDFALALWDDANRRLMLARDLMGVRPLYFWTSDRFCIAASEIKAILAHPEVERRPDDDGLADALLAGNPQDVRRTCFGGVSRVAPGSTVVVSASGVRELRHRVFDTEKQVRCASIEEYAERLRVLFLQAVRRRLRPEDGRAAILVSGGLDSSAIVCGGERLRETGAAVAPVHALSWLFPRHASADEAQNLDAIEAQHQLAIARIPAPAIALLDDERWVRTLEFPRLRWDSEARSLSAARAAGCAVVLDGYFGDQMISSDAPMFDLLRRCRIVRGVREFRATARSMRDTPPGQLLGEYAQYFLWEIAPEQALRLRRALRWRLRRDGRPRWYSRRFRDLAYRRSQLQRRGAGPFASTQAALCSRHFTTTHRLNMVEESNKLAAAHGLERAYPFMDRDLVEFVMAIPGEVVNWRGIYKGLFREAMIGILPESIRRRDWKADFTAVASDAAADGYARFREWFGPESRAAACGYIDRAIFLPEFARWQRRLTGSSIQPPNQVSAVVGLEIWLRAFFGSERHVQSAHQ